MGTAQPEALPKPYNRVGFVACYQGQEIAGSTSFKELMLKTEVKGLIGNKDLVIKHNVPEGLIAIY